MIREVLLEANRRVASGLARAGLPQLHRDSENGLVAVPIWFAEPLFDELVDGWRQTDATHVRLTPRTDGTYYLQMKVEQPTPEREVHVHIDLASHAFVTDLFGKTMELLVAIENADPALITDEVLERGRAVRRVVQARIG